jgi:hypothetical protein
LLAFTYVLFGSEVVLSGESDTTFWLTSVGTSSASQCIISYTLNKYKFSAYYFLLLTILTTIYGGASEIVRVWVQEKEYQLKTMPSGVYGQMR